MMLIVTLLFSFLFTALIIVALSGNVLVCAAVFFDRKLRRQPENLFLVSLAVSDLTVAVLVSSKNLACSPKNGVELTRKSRKLSLILASKLDSCKKPKTTSPKHKPLVNHSTQKRAFSNLPPFSSIPFWPVTKALVDLSSSSALNYEFTVSVATLFQSVQF